MVYTPGYATPPVIKGIFQFDVVTNSQIHANAIIAVVTIKSR